VSLYVEVHCYGFIEHLINGTKGKQKGNKRVMWGRGGGGGLYGTKNSVPIVYIFVELSLKKLKFLWA